MDALEAVVLAAGRGSRFGGAKLLAPWAGGVLLDAALAAALAAPVRSVTVVTGANGEDVATAARTCAARLGQAHRLRIAPAREHAEGMGRSLAAGMASLPADAAGVYLFLGDMPRVPHALLPSLADALAAGALAAAPTFDGRRGHPVLFGASLLPALARLRGDRGARDLLAGLGEAVVLVPSPDDGVLFDVDAPGDLA